jgi:hypothetical protein
MIRKLKSLSLPLSNAENITFESGFSRITGDASKLEGECSVHLYGEISSSSIGKRDLVGKLSKKLRGNITGVFGVVTDVVGDLDECQISAMDRVLGVNILDLVEGVSV